MCVYLQSTARMVHMTRVNKTAKLNCVDATQNFTTFVGLFYFCVFVDVFFGLASLQAEGSAYSAIPYTSPKRIEDTILQLGLLEMILAGLYAILAWVIACVHLSRKRHARAGTVPPWGSNALGALYCHALRRPYQRFSWG